MPCGLPCLGDDLTRLICERRNAQSGRRLRTESHTSIRTTTTQRGWRQKKAWAIPAVRACNPPGCVRSRPKPRGVEDAYIRLCMHSSRREATRHVEKAPINIMSAYPHNSGARIGVRPVSCCLPLLLCRLASYKYSQQGALRERSLYLLSLTRCLLYSGHVSSGLLLLELLLLLLLLVCAVPSGATTACTCWAERARHPAPDGLNWLRKERAGAKETCGISRHHQTQSSWLCDGEREEPWNTYPAKKGHQRKTMSHTTQRGPKKLQNLLRERVAGTTNLLQQWVPRVNLQTIRLPSGTHLPLGLYGRCAPAQQLSDECVRGVCFRLNTRLFLWPSS